MEEDGLLCPPINQVAGHYAEGGNIGPLIDKAGRFYKPLQNNQRGQHEVEFYEKFWADQTIPPIVQDLFPRFYGTRSVQASDETGMCEYAVIEDLTYHFHHPSVIDIKMGSRTWYPGATEEYIKKCLDKDGQSTSALLGFRLSGLQVYEIATKATWKPGKEWCNALSTEEVRLALKRFVSTNPFSETDPDGSLASFVYGEPGGVLSQLLELKSWFEEQTCFHFSSASILLIYEGDSKSTIQNSPRSGVSVKLVDFAHVINGQNIIDHNFLGGLCSLIKVISQTTADLGKKLPEEPPLTT
ncbi:inositol polyphosphate multikinase alpha-like isoform X1 [Cryptomeria japonica]|uniref:inositol polyphosphate multikinase alpha-like isoform X1 n=1 Tax=Cryptomeria japonica TaxID=3369 RepID=UPI0027DA6499|nr:inositol polyphosphate multikinase alpha-like isoform X1 [Cryptomeria japonica]XP_059073080.1 inositol polyphosphate multikinase alpha-like isoform X1 [Cryptomeria japonica]